MHKLRFRRLYRLGLFIFVHYYLLFMFKHLHFVLISGLFLLGWGLSVSSVADPNNPPTGNTGAPSEQTCARSGCHNGGSFTGTVTLTGLPDTVQSGQIYPITITNASNAVRGGFQMTCLDGANAMAGTFTAPQGSGVNIGSASGGRKYPRQSAAKSFGSAGMISWTFNWTAPATANNNRATFYFTSLCGNGDGEKTGDNVLQGTKTVVLQTASGVGETNTHPAFRVYPTMVDAGRLFVQLLDAAEGRMLVFDQSGKVALDRILKADNEIDVATLAKGMYVAYITTAGRSEAVKFVVK